MALAILHGGTRVIRRTTTDPSPDILPDEILVALPPTITDLGNGPWILNANGTLTKADAATIDAANTLPQIPEVQEIIDSLLFIRDNADTATVTQLRTMLKRMAVALLFIYNRPRRYGG